MLPSPSPTNGIILRCLDIIDIFINLLSGANATGGKKIHDKRQATSYASQYPTYFPAPRYSQYNPSFRNYGHTLQPSLSVQSPFFASSPNSQSLSVRPHEPYISYYYPHKTHFKDWSRKVLQAGDYAKKWQTARTQKLLLANQKANQGSGGIKFFVAGINKNGNMQSQWVGQTQLHKPNDGSTMNFKTALASNGPLDSKLQAQLVANPTMLQQQSPTQVNPVSNNTNLAAEPVSITQQTQTNSFHDKGSRENANSNHTSLSDNLAGAVLGPNAHSLLQLAVSQQTPADSTTFAPHQGVVGTSSYFNKEQSPVTNVPESRIPVQKQSEKLLSEKEQHSSVIELPVQVNSNSQPLKNPNAPLRSASSSIKAGQELTPANTTGVANNEVKNLQSIPQYSQDLPLDTHNMDKTTAQMLNLRLTSISASRPQSEVKYSPNSASSANTIPKNTAVVTRNSAAGKDISKEALINKELALKNILFPPPSVTRNLPFGGTQKNVTPQQIVPSFPAFRYNENRPVSSQFSFNTNRRDEIAHPLNRKWLVPQFNPVPYKSSFPLMLHKISPYFKMKRNLKQMANGQAKARRRFLELQSK